MAQIFYDNDANLDELQPLSLAVIGYGNQGRAHALNLRDSGLNVVVGAREHGEGYKRALQDGFQPVPVTKAAAENALLAIMVPDEAMPHLFNQVILPACAPSHDGKSISRTFVFAHGFCVREKLLNFPGDCDVVLVAPTGPGHQLRQMYLKGGGLPALVAVELEQEEVVVEVEIEQEYAKQSGERSMSGALPKAVSMAASKALSRALSRALAYAKGIGSTRAGVVLTTFEEETVVDLFCEQAVLCGGMPELIKRSFDTLVQAGYQPELAYISCLKEVKLIADLMFERGVDGMREAISNTAKYGSVVAGPKIVDGRVAATLQQVLGDIQSGEFARQYAREASGTGNPSPEESRIKLPAVQEFMRKERRSLLARIGEQLKSSLRF